MSSKEFLNKKNVSMIWDVISDEDIFKFLSKSNQLKIIAVFTNNLNGFYDNEILQSNTLIEINKKYIILMLSFIKQNYTNKPSKITILEEISPTNQKKLITYEEIHNDRTINFDKDLSRYQEDFTNAMTVKVPPIPEFSDKLEDIPITEMSKKIKEMTAMRNYDVEQINKGFNSKMQDETWLKPQETSIKNEKYQSPLINSQKKNSNVNSVNDFKIDNEENDLNKFEPKKNVTWGENVTKVIEVNQIINNDNLIESNIFKKLKRTEANPDNNEEIKQNVIYVTKRLSEIQEEISQLQKLIS